MRFSTVEVHPVHGDGAIKAVVNVILSGDYAVGPFRVMGGPNGLFVTYPKRQGGDGNWYSTFRPLSRDARQRLEERILTAYRDVDESSGGNKSEETA